MPRPVLALSLSAVALLAACTPAVHHTVPAGCAFGEPNDSADQAAPIDVDTTYADLCVTGSDGDDPADWFALTAPDDPAGGWISLAVSNVRDGGLAEFIVTSAADGGTLVDSYSSDPDQPVDGWFTVAPGAGYLVQVVRFAGTGPQYGYDLDVSYTALDDPFEPNQTPDQAQALDLGEPVSASGAVVSPNAELAPEDDVDDYRVSLGAGDATVAVTDVPADYLCDVQLFDGSGEPVDEAYSGDPGGDCLLEAHDLVGGDYVVDVHTFAGVPTRGGVGAPPAFVTGSYTLEVDQ